jgi:hypothetical protein
MIFWREKEEEEKNCASRFEAKKAVMPWEIRDCLWRAASWRHNCTGTGYSSTVLFWLFREINGVVFKNRLTINRAIQWAEILPTIALIMSADFSNAAEEEIASRSEAISDGAERVLNFSILYTHPHIPTNTSLHKTLLSTYMRRS